MEKACRVAEVGGFEGRDSCILEDVAIESPGEGELYFYA